MLLLGVIAVVGVSNFALAIAGAMVAAMVGDINVDVDSGGCPMLLLKQSAVGSLMFSTFGEVVVEDVGVGYCWLWHYCWCRLLLVVDVAI